MAQSFFEVDEHMFDGMSDEQIAEMGKAMERQLANALSIEDLVTIVRQTAYQVHLYLGTGYLEKVYENTLKHRLEKRGLKVAAQVPLTVTDEDGFVVGEYEADLIVENRIIIELKHVSVLAAQHKAQLINYLCTTGIEHGLLINFGSAKFEIREFVYTKKNMTKSGEAAIITSAPSLRPFVAKTRSEESNITGVK